jgi:metallo-beta-lactamase family protein
LETDSAELLIDCGLFQGSKTEKELKLSGLSVQGSMGPRRNPKPRAHRPFRSVAKLVREGFSGPIHATTATADLAAVVLRDGTHIQEVEHLNRR